MDRLPVQLTALTLAWLGWFALHSGLADSRCKAWLQRRWPRLGPAYRLLYNAIAALTLLLPLGLLAVYPGPWLWRWSGAPALIAAVATGLALAGFAWTLRGYDGAEFAGLRQWRQRREATTEADALVLGGLHRYLRHPWYGLALVLVWTRDMSAAWLVSALLISLYLLVGSRLEERRLIGRFGPAYCAYRERVPALVPWPGRHLGRGEARRLEEQARAHASAQGTFGPGAASG